MAGKWRAVAKGQVKLAAFHRVPVWATALVAAAARTLTVSDAPRRARQLGRSVAGVHARSPWCLRCCTAGARVEGSGALSRLQCSVAAAGRRGGWSWGSEDWRRARLRCLASAKRTQLAASCLGGRPTCRHAATLTHPANQPTSSCPRYAASPRVRRGNVGFVSHETSKSRPQLLRCLHSVAAVSLVLSFDPAGRRCAPVRHQPALLPHHLNAAEQLATPLQHRTHHPSTSPTPVCPIRALCVTPARQPAPCPPARPSSALTRCYYLWRFQGGAHSVLSDHSPSPIAAN